MPNGTIRDEIKDQIETLVTHITLFLKRDYSVKVDKQRDEMTADFQDGANAGRALSDEAFVREVVSKHLTIALQIPRTPRQIDKLPPGQEHQAVDALIAYLRRQSLPGWPPYQNGNHVAGPSVLDDTDDDFDSPVAPQSGWSRTKTRTRAVAAAFTNHWSQGIDRSRKNAGALLLGVGLLFLLVVWLLPPGNPFLILALYVVAIALIMSGVSILSKRVWGGLAVGAVLLLALSQFGPIFRPVQPLPAASVTPPVATTPVPPAQVSGSQAVEKEKAKKSSGSGGVAAKVAKPAENTANTSTGQNDVQKMRQDIRDLQKGMADVTERVGKVEKQLSGSERTTAATRKPPTATAAAKRTARNRTKGGSAVDFSNLRPGYTGLVERVWDKKTRRMTTRKLQCEPFVVGCVAYRP